MQFGFYCIGQRRRLHLKQLAGAQSCLSKLTEHKFKYCICVSLSEPVGQRSKKLDLYWLNFSHTAETRQEVAGLILLSGIWHFRWKRCVVTGVWDNWFVALNPVWYNLQSGWIQMFYCLQCAVKLLVINCGAFILKAPLLMSKHRLNVAELMQDLVSLKVEFKS